jgi:hypothetical protein
MKITLRKNFSVPQSVFTFRNIPLLDKFFLKSYLNNVYNLGYRIGFFDTIRKIGGVAFYKVGYKEGVKAGLEKLKSVSNLTKLDIPQTILRIMDFRLKKFPELINKTK